MKKYFLLQTVLTLILTFDVKAEQDCQEITIVYPQFTGGGLNANWWGSAWYTSCGEHKKYGDKSSDGLTVTYNAQVGTHFQFGAQASNYSPVDFTVGKGPSRYACWGLVGSANCIPCDDGWCIQKIEDMNPGGGGGIH